MKINKKTLLITICMILLAIVVFYLNVAVFVSGPASKYDSKIAKEEQSIRAQYKDITIINRHVFQYVVYIGEDEDHYVWFNNKSKAIDQRTKDTYREEEVKSLVASTYEASDIHVKLGFGYKKPCYVVNCDQGMILLDYDSLKEVYYLKKGE